MSQSTLFSSGLELASFVASSGLLVRAWKVILSPHDGNNNSNVGVELYWKVHKDLDNDLTIIAFETISVPNLEVDLVSSSDLRDKNFLQFDFLCTKSNPFFSVNKTAIDLFYENHHKLDQLKSQISSSTALIVTGKALAGSIASLFTLSLLDSIGSGKNRPLCITFGSPLIGDKKMQQAISRSSTWNSCFLNVASLKDPLPWLLISSPAYASSPQTSSYMPFGTYLLCSDVYSICFESPDTILELINTTSSIQVQNQGFQSADYGNIVESLYGKAICKDLTAQADNTTHSSSLLASISLQLQALGFTPHVQQQQQQQQNIDMKTLLAKMETLEKKFNFQKRKTFDPSKKLNMVKVDMAQLEWYKKVSKTQNIGYYDSYKRMLLTCDQDVVKFQRSLTNYWENMVKEAEMKPQKEGAAFRKRWLFAGTNYRRMVEPLDIAQYYKEGGKDYVTEKRSRHYQQLEEWLREWSTSDTSGSDNTNKKNNVESILTIDSCFWAHVEEALISCKKFKDAKSSVIEKEEARRKLNEFSDYVYGLLKNYEVSPEIFLKESSYMSWWGEYKRTDGTSHNPGLASFMNNANNYNLYAGGNYNFC